MGTLRRVPEPTVHDAIRLLTDPRNRATGGSRQRHGRLREAAIFGELEAQSNMATARALVTEAVRRPRGTSRMQMVRASEGDWHERDEVWVPESALRHPDV